MNGQPKPAFFFVVLLVILSLIGYAFYRYQGSTTTAGNPPYSSGNSDAPVDSASGPNDSPADSSAGPEAADSQSVATTVKEYSYVPSARLPDVQGVSNYTALGEPRVVKMALNVWAGWAPIVFANDGHKPGKLWKTADGKSFQLELVLLDDPVAMRDAFAAGQVHTGWSTVDMLPLMVQGLRKDSRVMPRIFQQIDWSNGGDGIVVRQNIKSAADLEGKKVVLAQNSPSHFFLINTLINAGVSPNDVNMIFTNSAFEAAAAFNADKTIAGVVSWAPDIYNLAEGKGNKMLVSTQTANKLISDVWFARADFARDNPAIIESIVRGIFDGMLALEDASKKPATAKLLADFYSIPEADALGMLPDAYPTNVAENREFFLNQNNPTNFERTYNTAFAMYRKLSAIDPTRTGFDQLVDFSVLQKLLKEDKYANQTSNYGVNFVPLSASSIQSESNEILTKTVVIQFFPNSFDLEKMIERQLNGKTITEPYDPQVTFVVEEIARLAGQYGAARIVIEGHTDASMRGNVPESAVLELSENRANAVKESIIRKFPTLQPNQFTASGLGWKRPADPGDPENDAKNRRVEIKVYPLESQ
jgi:NitT/TauT family transport system substrate-binding protein